MIAVGDFGADFRRIAFLNSILHSRCLITNLYSSCSTDNFRMADHPPTGLLCGDKGVSVYRFLRLSGELPILRSAVRRNDLNLGASRYHLRGRMDDLSSALDLL